jgi:hypothetical protein
VLLLVIEPGQSTPALTICSASAPYKPRLEPVKFPFRPATGHELIDTQLRKCNLIEGAESAPLRRQNSSSIGERPQGFTVAAQGSARVG